MGALDFFAERDAIADAWRSAARSVDHRAFYVREDAAMVARMEADPFASVDQIEKGRVSLARHKAQLAAAEQNLAHWQGRMVAAGIPFRGGPLSQPKPVMDEDAALAELQGAMAAIEEADAAGVEAPFMVLIQIGRLAEAVL